MCFLLISNFIRGNFMICIGENWDISLLLYIVPKCIVLNISKLTVSWQHFQNVHAILAFLLYQLQYYSSQPLYPFIFRKRINVMDHKSVTRLYCWRRTSNLNFRCELPIFMLHVAEPRSQDLWGMWYVAFALSTQQKF